MKLKYNTVTYCRPAFINPFLVLHSLQGASVQPKSQLLPPWTVSAQSECPGCAEVSQPCEFTVLKPHWSWEELTTEWQNRNELRELVKYLINVVLIRYFVLPINVATWESWATLDIAYWKSATDDQGLYCWLKEGEIRQTEVKNVTDYLDLRMRARHKGCSCGILRKAMRKTMVRTRQGITTGRL